MVASLRLLYCMGDLVPFQFTWVRESLVTLSADKLLLYCVRESIGRFKGGDLHFALDQCVDHIGRRIV